MPFKVAVVYFSRHGLLVTLANIIAAGARKVCNVPCRHLAAEKTSGSVRHKLLALQVPGAEVKVYRISDPVGGDNPEHFEEGVLDAPLVTEKVGFTPYAHARLKVLLSYSSHPVAITGYLGC